VSGVDILIQSDDQAQIVCRMVSEDHNELSSAPIDDGWSEHTSLLETQCQYHMMADSSSSDSDQQVNSEDDLVYENHAYI